MPDAIATQRPPLSARLRVWFKAQAAELDRHEGLDWRRQLAVFGIVAAILILRSPSLFLHAQFYAEDGTVWFKDAYDSGWLHSLTIPDGGYLNTLQRIGAGFAMLAPFRWVPLMMAFFGLAVQSSIVTILLSPRTRNWGSLSMRVLLAAIYVFKPNAHEIHVVLTNCQWNMGFAEMILAFACAPRTWWGRVFDIGFFLLAGFCGPFGIVMLPLVLVFWFVRRQRWTLAIPACLSVGVAFQFYFLTHNNNRIETPLGAGLRPLVRMVGVNIVGCSMFGGYNFNKFAPFALALAAAIGGILLYLYCLRFAKLEYKLLIVYSWILLAAALRSPLIDGPKPRWDLLTLTASGRYWFFPMMAFLWGAVWCMYYAKDRLFRNAGKWILIAMLVGVVDNFVYKSYENKNFPEYARRFKQAAPGTHLSIPIPPIPIFIELVKKEPAGKG